LEAVDISCTRSDRRLFEGVTFHLAPGEALWVTGSNGRGKSSLLRILCGLAEPAGGIVRWEGRPIRAAREQFHGKLAYIGHASGIKEELLVWENLAMAAALAGVAVDMQAACDALGRLGMAHAADTPVRMLSQGQRKRVALARLALGIARPLWILDEPFTSLDAGSAQALCDIIDSHLAQGGMLVYTTHQEVRFRASRQSRIDLEETHADDR
jgi:heme exporter protein A